MSQRRAKELHRLGVSVSKDSESWIERGTCNIGTSVFVLETATEQEGSLLDCF